MSVVDVNRVLVTANINHYFNNTYKIYGLANSFRNNLVRIYNYILLSECYEKCTMQHHFLTGFL